MAHGRSDLAMGVTGLVLFTVGIGLAVSACSREVKLVQGASLEDAQPVPGILRSQRLLTGTIVALAGDRITVAGEGLPKSLSLAAGGEEARELRVGDQVQMLVNDENIVVAYQRPSVTPPTKIFRGSLSQMPHEEMERAVVRLESGKDISLYATPDAMSELAALEIGEPADFALDRTYKLVDVHSLGKPRDRSGDSSPKSVHRRLDGAFVTIDEGKVRLRTRPDTIITLPVRPLLLPAFEQLSLNEEISTFLDADGHVIDMARIAPVPQTKRSR